MGLLDRVDQCVKVSIMAGSLSSSVMVSKMSLRAERRSQEPAGLMPNTHL